MTLRNGRDIVAEETSHVGRSAAQHDPQRGPQPADVQAEAVVLAQARTDTQQERQAGRRGGRRQAEAVDAEETVVVEQGAWENVAENVVPRAAAGQKQHVFQVRRLRFALVDGHLQRQRLSGAKDFERRQSAGCGWPAQPGQYVFHKRRAAVPKPYGRTGQVIGRWLRSVGERLPVVVGRLKTIFVSRAIVAEYQINNSLII